jgi:hypothetical protein
VCISSVYLYNVEINSNSDGARLANPTGSLKYSFAPNIPMTSEHGKVPKTPSQHPRSLEGEKTWHQWTSIRDLGSKISQMWRRAQDGRLHVSFLTPMHGNVIIPLWRVPFLQTNHVSSRRIKGPAMNRRLWYTPITEALKEVVSGTISRTCHNKTMCCGHTKSHKGTRCHRRSKL